VQSEASAAAAAICCQSHKHSMLSISDQLPNS